jgi:hypothetical protein
MIKKEWLWINGYKDTPLKFEEFDRYFIPKIESIINKHYIVTPSFERTTIRCYKQTNQDESYIFHNHVGILGNINVIFYINIPKEGGELEFLDPVSNTIRIKPQKDKIYLMPQWLYHTPLPHKDDITRISFNWSYAGTNRPIHKQTGDVW